MFDSKEMLSGRWNIEINFFKFGFIYQRRKIHNFAVNQASFTRVFHKRLV